MLILGAVNSAYEAYWMPNNRTIIDSCTEYDMETAAFDDSQHVTLSLEGRSQRSSWAGVEIA